ncbi:MAG: nucleotidyltransferase domain-containing protein [Planctomycetaceae bacterium]|nr:nucleotidyltransferase domain-containing protein [Planctomycetaceae bacterium]
MLRNHKEHLSRQFGISKLGLFGSFARGDATDESDIDICFDTNDSSPFVAVHIRDTLEKIFQRRVDVVQQHRYLRPLFIKRLEQDVIYV